MVDLEAAVGPSECKVLNAVLVLLLTGRPELVTVLEPLLVIGTSENEGLIAELELLIVVALGGKDKMGVVALKVARTATSSSLVLHFFSALSNTIVVRVVRVIITIC